jgi:hypothetical protein
VSPAARRTKNSAAHLTPKVVEQVRQERLLRGEEVGREALVQPVPRQLLEGRFGGVVFEEVELAVVGHGQRHWHVIEEVFVVVGAVWGLMRGSGKAICAPGIVFSAPIHGIPLTKKLVAENKDGRFGSLSR